MSVEIPFEHAGEACPAPASGHAPGDEELVELLATARTVAVVGASPSDHRTSYGIATWLMGRTPYEIYLVNPRAGEQEIRGHGFYDSLDQLPVVPDIVDVFRRSEHVPPVADEAIAAGAGALWLQLGVVHDASAAQATAAGLTVVQNRCIKVEYERLRDRIEAARDA
ncbi:CoA-binding protein [Demequina sp. NBRC 110056]|uniref:CoA-binding protein n=1 Tax=Demequina sp. NBRC 110056 TaxID=1570345 RepID=UPI000A002C28|nr:CoA-binding protein [Demequina sp. NBRC 110056]